ECHPMSNSRKLASFCLILAGSFLLGCFGNTAAAADKPTEAFPLWPEGAPGALGKADTDIPTLTPYWPDAAKATGAAIIVCPAGGYNMLAQHEGPAYARWLNELGI